MLKKLEPNCSAIGYFLLTKIRIADRRTICVKVHRWVGGGQPNDWSTSVNRLLVISVKRAVTLEPFHVGWPSSSRVI